MSVIDVGKSSLAKLASLPASPGKKKDLGNFTRA